MKRLALLAPLALAAALGLSACGGGSPSAGSSSSTMAMSTDPGSASGSTAAPGNATVMLTIKSFKFSGATSVAPGAKVMVMNQDSEAHTVTSDDGTTFDVKVGPGASVTFTAPTKPGSYAYHCSYHANMHGTLTVS